MSKIIILFIFLYATQCKFHQEAKLNFIEYCDYFNYPVEKHQIQTKDGYILTFFRIQAKQSKIVSGKEVVLLQHGLLDSSDTFILNDEEKAIGFVLANQGYDVWLGNNRGNKHSRQHIEYSIDQAEFWNFSVEEFALFDLPDSMEYIYSLTNKKINYIGHSQGTTLMHINLALNKDSIVKQLLNKYVALSPSAFVTKKSTILLKILDSGLLQLLEKFGIHQFMPGDTFLSTTVGRIYCSLFPIYCGYIIDSTVNADPKIDNYERFDVFAAHYPGGTSLKNLMHRQQVQATGRFARFDYGEEENLKKYGVTQAPLYDLSNIDIPIYIFAGKYDRLAPSGDVEAFANAISSKYIEKKYYEAGHCTYVWGKDIQEILEDILRILSSQ